MTATHHKSHQIRSRMHYALFVTLVISNVTTLLLGVLFAQSMGFGLGEIASLKYYREIAETQSAFAKSTALSCSKVSLSALSQIAADPARSALLKERLRGATKEMRAFARDSSEQTTNGALTLKQLQIKAQERKNDLVELLYIDPVAAVEELLLPDERSAINAVLSNCVETPVIERGLLEVLVIEDFKSGAGREQVTLITSQKKRLTIVPVGGAPYVRSGIEATVTGLQVDESIIFGDAVTPFAAAGAVSEILLSPITAQLTSSLGDQKTLIIGVNFPNTTRPILATSTMESAMTSTDLYIRENSYNQSSFSGFIDPGKKADFLGWYDLQQNLTGCNSFFGYNPTPIFDEVAQVLDPQVDWNTYNRLVIVGPFQTCNWLGIAYLGTPTMTTPDGQVVLGWLLIDASSVNTPVLPHEFGHTFGSTHAGRISCGSASLAQSGCSTDSYGDEYDVMGNYDLIGTPHMSGYHKWQSGWIPQSGIQDITTGGTYTLTPIESVASEFKTLRVPRDGIGNEMLSIEYRQPIGFDASFGSSHNIFQGALLYTLNPPFGNSYLVDATPPFNIATPSLSLGTTFTDPATGATVRPISKTSTELTVAVTPPCKTDYTAPYVAVTSPAANATVYGTITVAANVNEISAGNSGITKVEFYYRDNRVTPSVYRLLSTDTTAPYQTLFNTTIVNDGASAVAVTAYDGAGVACNAFNNIRTEYRNFEIINNDTIPPVVTITSPSSGGLAGSSISIQASASDNVAVARVEFYEDISGSSTLLGSSTFQPFFVNPSLPAGDHTVFARAFDPAGNSSYSASVTFIVDPDPPTLSIVNPRNGTAVRGSITIRIEGSDASGVDYISAYMLASGSEGTGQGGFTYLGSSASSPLTASLDTKTKPDGVYTINASATDRAGNYSQATISFEIRNALVGGGSHGGGGKLQQDAP